ncbi:MAG: 30S ribosomal protein S1 [Deltaproteobacteria bacterium RIFCSPLOWO2_02_FULL_47_10]|nr:MAG: 30S ribosomal protein S1 [Deltaproteobacteria bacterium RIFCSPLOWO2_02_FULL_47_10]
MESFAQLFEESLKKSPVREGEIVRGKVVKVLKDYVMIDIGFKAEGKVPIEEFQGFDGKVNANLGDDIDVFLETMEDEQGEMVLSKEHADVMKTWDKLVEAEKNDAPIDGKVLSKVKGGFSVDIGVKAFLPASQIDIKPPKNLDKYVGKVFSFKIVKLNKSRGNVVLSRKVMLEKEREGLKVETLANLQDGQIYEGVVKGVTDYGAFVDIGGIDGLLHVADMSWGHITHPSEVLAVGDEIKVKVLKYDKDTQRISLGMKQLAPDPWSQTEEKYPVGSRVRGKVTTLADYGAFVEIEEGVEGLVHVSEMSWTKKIKHPSKIMSVGDVIDSVVLDVDIANRRISLGLKQIGENPWETMSSRYPIGTRIKGIIRNITDFGLFVDVNGEVDGLVHINDIAWVQNFTHPSEVFNKGQDVEAIVLHIDPESERFSIGVKQLLDDPWDVIGAKYLQGTKIDEGTVVKHVSSGYIVQLEPGVEGLLPNSEAKEELATGAKLTVRVKQAEQKERKFILQCEK